MSLEPLGAQSSRSGGRNGTNLYQQIYQATQSTNRQDWLGSDQARKVDEEYQRSRECPLCKGAKFLSVKLDQHPWYDSKPCECLDPSGVQRAMARYARLPMQERLTVQNFTRTEENDHAFRQVILYLDRADAVKPFLLLVGAVGTGKTHLLQAIGWEMIHESRPTIFLPVAEWLDQLRETYQEGSDISLRAIHEPFQTVDTLLLDDLGAEVISPWGVEQILKLLNHRIWESRRTVISTNLDYEGMSRQIGRRVADRVFDQRMVTVAHTGYTSWRTGQQL